MRAEDLSNWLFSPRISRSACNQSCKWYPSKHPRCWYSSYARAAMRISRSCTGPGPLTPVGGGADFFDGRDLLLVVSGFFFIQVPFSFVAPANHTLLRPSGRISSWHNNILKKIPAFTQNAESRRAVPTPPADAAQVPSRGARPPPPRSPHNRSLPCHAAATPQQHTTPPPVHKNGHMRHASFGE